MGVRPCEQRCGERDYRGRSEDEESHGPATHGASIDAVSMPEPSLARWVHVPVNPHGAVGRYAKYKRVRSTPTLTLLAVVGCAGCAEHVERAAVDPSRLRSAVERLHAGAESTTLVSNDGVAHPVGAADRLTYLDGALTVRGAWTLGEVGASCAPGSTSVCPADPAFARTLVVDPQSHIEGTPWLEQKHRRLSDGGQFAIGAGIGVVVVGGLVGAEAMCFRSWCGDGGKTAVVVADVGLAVGAVALVLVMSDIARAMHH